MLVFTKNWRKSVLHAQNVTWWKKNDTSRNENVKTVFHIICRYFIRALPPHLGWVASSYSRQILLYQLFYQTIPCPSNTEMGTGNFWFILHVGRDMSLCFWSQHFVLPATVSEWIDGWLSPTTHPDVEAMPWIKHLHIWKLFLNMAFFFHQWNGGFRTTTWTCLFPTKGRPEFSPMTVNMYQHPDMINFCFCCYLITENRFS